MYKSSLACQLRNIIGWQDISQLRSLEFASVNGRSSRFQQGPVCLLSLRARWSQIAAACNRKLANDSVRKIFWGKTALHSVWIKCFRWSLMWPSWSANQWLAVRVFFGRVEARTFFLEWASSPVYTPPLFVKYFVMRSQKRLFDVLLGYQCACVLVGISIYSTHLKYFFMLWMEAYGPLCLSKALFLVLERTWASCLYHHTLIPDHEKRACNRPPRNTQIIVSSS